ARPRKLCSGKIDGTKICAVENGAFQVASAQGDHAADLLELIVLVKLGMIDDINAGHDQPVSPRAVRLPVDEIDLTVEQQVVERTPVIAFLPLRLKCQRNTTAGRESVEPIAGERHERQRNEHDKGGRSHGKSVNKPA